MTIKSKIWHLMRAHGRPMARRQLIALTGRSQGSIEKALKLLRRQGCVKHMGTASTAGRWYATAKQPTDLRGAHPNSIKNREKGQQINAQWAQLTCGILPQPGTEVERCWPVQR